MLKNFNHPPFFKNSEFPNFFRALVEVSKPSRSAGSGQLRSAVPMGIFLCRNLCRNPVIPAGVRRLLAVSIGYTRKAVNLREVRMNTACSCRSVSLPFAPSQFVLGNGMEEVIGSIPIRSTIKSSPKPMAYHRSSRIVTPCVETGRLI